MVCYWVRDGLPDMAGRQQASSQPQPHLHPPEPMTRHETGSLFPATRFPDRFARELHELFLWRRDVRKFRLDPAPVSLIHDLLCDAATMSPSVGLSQPSRFVYVETKQARYAALQNFEAANERALLGYLGEQKQLYASLKLSGMREAPVQIAAFCADETEQGCGLGAATMPETLSYSVVCAIMQFWLATRAAGLGLGWVSILEPEALKNSLGVDAGWSLIGYLCVGWPDEESLNPELERAGWERRRHGDDHITRV